MSIEKTRRTTHIQRLSERVAVHPRIQAAVQGAVQTALPGVIEDCLAAMFPDIEGDYIKLAIYRRKRKPADQKLARDQRIEASLGAGETVHSIARREGVSDRHVFRVKARLAAAPLKELAGAA